MRFPYKELKPRGDKPATLIVHGAFISPNGLSEMGGKAIMQIIGNIDNLRYIADMTTCEYVYNSQHT